MGIVLGHLVNLSIQVKRYMYPAISMWTWSNLASGIANVQGGVVMHFSMLTMKTGTGPSADVRLDP